MTSKIRVQYLLVAVVIFVALAAIETQLDTGFIRFTVGDSLAVMLVYALFMASTKFTSLTAGITALLIAYAVEIGQALQIVDRLGIEPNRFTNVVFGNTFTWSDMAAYTAGIAVTLAGEFLRQRPLGV